MERFADTVLRGDAPVEDAHKAGYCDLFDKHWREQADRLQRRCPAAAQASTLGARSADLDQTCSPPATRLQRARSHELAAQTASDAATCAAKSCGTAPVPAAAAPEPHELVVPAYQACGPLEVFDDAEPIPEGEPEKEDESLGWMNLEDESLDSCVLA